MEMSVLQEGKKNWLLCQFIMMVFDVWTQTLSFSLSFPVRYWTALLIYFVFFLLISFVFSLFSLSRHLYPYTPYV